MKPKVTVISKGGRPRPPLCPWLIDNLDAPPRQNTK
jgi:hypothetical protein